MSPARRTIERRRRVLYSASVETQGATAASRRDVARLRQARCPSATYGSRVQHRLRGRWFALVPVRRRTITLVVTVLLAVTGLLCFAHYTAVAWPSVAYRGEIARPLRLDRPDSFGAWFAGMLMLGTAGVSFLIFQLRRHRLDDFRGHYRLWGVVLLVMVLAALNSAVSLIDWGGALLDVAIGRRVAMAGADWIRILVSIGGAVLGLRLLAEVRRAPMAIAFLSVAAILLALPEAATWRLIDVETMLRWTFVTAAPLMGFTALFVACLAYLRMLYREVRRLNETDTLAARWQSLRLRLVRHESDEDESQPETEVETASPSSPRRRWWQRQRRAADQRPADNRGTAAKRRARSEESPATEESEPAVAAGTEQPSDRPRRRWWGLRRAKPPADEQDAESTQADEPASAEPKKRRRFSLRLSPPRRKDADDESAEASPRPERSSPPAGPAADPDPETIEGDDIDWNGLSKAERRRLRKQLKRQQRAA